MKRVSTIIAILLLCISMTACATGVPGGNPVKDIDPYSEPVIVVDEETVERQERYDSEGNHVGYYQFTSGTNCDVPGIVLVEYLDLDRNVLKAYSPQFAGCTMGYSVDEEYESYNELTTICEVSHRGVTSIEYTITPFTCGKAEVAVYTVKGTTNQVDVYGDDGEVAVSMKPVKEGSSLAVGSWADDCLLVWEYYADKTYHSYTEREFFFDSNRNMICEVLVTPELLKGSNNVVFTRLEVKSSDGQTRRVYEQSMEGTQFSIGGNGDGIQLTIYEEMKDGKRIWHEVYDPVQDQVIFKEKVIHDDNGNYSHRELEVFGGKVVTTESQYPGYYVKAEFYDAQGDLRKTVDTTETGEYFIVKWDKNNNDCLIEFYTENGPTGNIDFYEPY